MRRRTGPAQARARRAAEPEQEAAAAAEASARGERKRRGHVPPASHVAGPRPRPRPVTAPAAGSSLLTHKHAGAAGAPLWHLIQAASASPVPQLSAGSATVDRKRVCSRRREWPCRRLCFPNGFLSGCEGASPRDPEPDRPRCRGAGGGPGPPHTAGCVLCPLRSLTCSSSHQNQFIYIKNC